MMAFGVTTVAQNATNAPTLNQTVCPHLKHLKSYDVLASQPSSAPVKTPVVTESKGLQKIAFASSANIYSLISTDQSVLTADPDHNAIVFFARAGGSFGGSGDELRISSSDDDGTNWDHTVISPESGKRVRYPSGGILDLPSATSLDDCFALYSGPITGGSSWSHNMFGSVKMDGTLENTIYDAIPATTYFSHANSNLSICNDSSIHVAGDNYVGTSSDYYWGNGILYNGKFNSGSNSIVWDPVMNMNHNFAIDASSGNRAAASVSMAWNEDGTVGYYLFRGRDSLNDQRAYQPIIYKSVDAGSTWNLEPVFDFSNLTEITDHIRGTLADPNLKKAFFSSEMDAVVDHNGLLHIFAVIQGSYSDHNDSLGYTFLYEQPKLFHVYMDGTGGWEAELITYIYSYDVSADDQIFGSGADAMGWSHRINAARTEDGSKLFVVWSDTDSTLAAPNGDGAPINTAPDIWAWGKDLSSDTEYPATNFTSGTQYWGDNYFHFASDIALEVNSNALMVPVSTADIGSTPLDEVTHNLLLNIGFGPGMSVEDAKGQNLMTVSQNFPNPFTETTNIAVELKEGTNLSLQVYNITGQEVYTEDKGKLTAGAYNFAVSARNLKAGIYFYKVNAGNVSVTKKMIVR